jgi:uncharacterized protein (DUF2164 family)
VKIELSKEARSDAITSIQRYFQENMPEPIGNMAAGLLLNYFVEEVEPAIYNQAIADGQARIQQRLSAEEIRNAREHGVGPMEESTVSHKLTWDRGSHVSRRERPQGKA